MPHGDGMVATCYLGKQRREALDAAIEKTGWMHSHYVRVAILEKLAREGFLSQAHVELEVEKAEYRRGKPHGNSKRAKEAAHESARARTREGAHSRQEMHSGTRDARTGARTGEAVDRYKLRAARRERLRREEQGHDTAV